MRLTAKSEYGLLALIDLACEGQGAPVSAREIAERQSIPTKFLEQLFVALRRAGIVTARRGAKGGFVLERDPARITVLDIVEALEGPLAPTVCEGDTACAKSPMCAASTVWGRATRALRDVLGSTTLADLAQVQTAMGSRGTVAER
ncbi:MAG TPA: RrF2 family transcriptional regulator [Coriobacteriia bacterium]|jgi:Rrf2 family protein